MLTSITPLGERGRGSRWGLTFAFLMVGSVTGGGALGGVLGSAGGLTFGAPGHGDTTRLYVLGAVLAVGIALELGVAGLRLPTVRRQVDERWLGAYRGWVYGLGFGLQLGTGLATIVSTAAVYSAFAACVLSGQAIAGVAIGACFGLARGVALVAASSAVDPPSLMVLGQRIHRWAPRAQTAGIAAQLILALVAVAVGAR